MYQRKNCERHERDYWKYISSLRQQSSQLKLSQFPREYLREKEHSRRRTSIERQHHYERIQRENDLLRKHIEQTRGKLPSKEEYDKDWQGHIRTMKNMCQYPENIDRFVSNEKMKMKNNQ